MQRIRQRRMPRTIWGGIILLTLFLAGCGGTHSAGNAANGASASGLQGTDLGASPAPDFHLVDQNHQAISLAQFKGMPVIITFFYTHCTTSCPLIANKIDRPWSNWVRQPSGWRSWRLVLIPAEIHRPVPRPFRRCINSWDTRTGIMYWERAGN